MNVWKESYMVAPISRFILLAAVALCCSVPRVVSSLSLSVVLPLTNNKLVSQETTQGLLRSAFHDIVDSSEIFEHDPAQNTVDTVLCCRAPLFGEDVIVTLRPAQEVAVAAENNDYGGGNLKSISVAPSPAISSPSEEYILTFYGSSNEDEFGWICAKFYECRDSFGDAMDLTELRSRVIGHFNAQPPHPGYDAASAAWSGSPQTKRLFADTKILKELEDSGFVVIESGPKTSTLQNDRLSSFLVEKTNQGSAVRRDTVHFLSQDDAHFCGLENQYEIMMSIASHLNDNFDFSASPHSPAYPATDAKPFTNPRMIQLAEYGEDDFYKIHSDNSFANGGESCVRSNYRSYTCILYCNDNWTPTMGGALRLYPDSRDFGTPEAARAGCEHVDINPLNGRLLIFDSCLAHSVEQVTQSDQPRRALTLWITRPNDSGVAGESFY